MNKKIILGITLLLLANKMPAPDGPVDMFPGEWGHRTIPLHVQQRDMPYNSEIESQQRAFKRNQSDNKQAIIKQLHDLANKVQKYADSTPQKKALHQAKEAQTAAYTAIHHALFNVNQAHQKSVSAMNSYVHRKTKNLFSIYMSAYKKPTASGKLSVQVKQAFKAYKAEKDKVEKSQTFLTLKAKSTNDWNTYLATKKKLLNDSQLGNNVKTARAALKKAEKDFNNSEWGRSSRAAWKAYRAVAPRIDRHGPVDLGIPRIQRDFK